MKFAMLILFMISFAHAEELITKTQYSNLLSKIQKEFSPDVVKKGAVLKFRDRWDAEIKLAMASRTGNTWEVHISGSYVTRPGMTLDALTHLACHELGHHLAGAPIIQELSPFDPVGSRPWSGAEAQSDFYAASVCLKRLWGKADNQAALKGVEVSPDIIKKCNDRYREPKQKFLCQRIIHSAYVKHSVALTDLPFLSDELPHEDLELSTPDPCHVDVTISEEYPNVQCRLDTAIAGALCKRDPITYLGSNNPLENGCNPKGDKKDDIGARPSCWYHY